MDFGLILLLLFIVAPLLERLLKAGRPQDPAGGQQPRPGQRPQAPQRPRPQPRMEAEDEESAAAMLPDDLWEILTGERRPTAQQRPPEAESYPGPDAWDAPAPRSQPAPPAPAPPPRRAEARPGPQRSGRAGRERQLPRVEPRRLPDVAERRLPPVEIRRPGHVVRQRSGGPPPGAADEYVREIPVHEAPIVVSMETPLEDSDIRRARFHQRLADTATPAARPAAANPYAIASDADLRRAIVMAEILGPPKGLQ